MYLAITMAISAPTTRFMSMAVAMFLSMFMEIFMEESALYQRKDLINFKLFGSFFYCIHAMASRSRKEYNFGWIG
jgi:hypothetical protein